MGGLGDMLVAQTGLFLRKRVGPARVERRPTIENRRENLVGRRGEAQASPTYRFRCPNEATRAAATC